MTRVAVLVSVGRHPASGRERRADADARALELALRMPDAEIHAVHAGDPDAPALRDYLGMGLADLNVLAVPAGHDPVSALADHLRILSPDLVLAGHCAETGEGSGMVPYLLAEALGAGLAADAAAVDCQAARATVVQALARGRRREVSLALPGLVVVGPAAPRPRAAAYGRARRGRIIPLAAQSGEDAFLTSCETRLWRARPRRMTVPGGGSALARMKAMTESHAGEGQLLVDPAPREAAQALLEYLKRKGFVDSDAADAAPGRGPGCE